MPSSHSPKRRCLRPDRRLSRQRKRRCIEADWHSALVDQQRRPQQIERNPRRGPSRAPLCQRNRRRADRLPSTKRVPPREFITNAGPAPILP
jgi:hypothetical protein